MRLFLLLVFTIEFALATVTITQENQLADNFTLPYLYDDSRALTITDISTTHFDTNTSNRFAFGHLSGNTWFKIKIRNQTQNNSLVLYLDEPWFVDFNLYYKSDGKFIEENCGLYKPLSTRDKEYIYPLFYLDIAPNETKTYYIQAHSKLSQVGSLKIATKKVFNSHKESLPLYLYSFYFGGLLIMLLLNIFLFIRVRERIYAYYASYVLSTGIFVFVLSGICLYFGFAPQFYDMQASVPIMMIFLILFSMELLDIKHYLPRCYKVLVGFISLFTLLSVLIIFELKPWLEIMNNVATLALLLLIYVSLKIGVKGNTNAKMYLPVMIIYVISLALMSFVFSAHIENTPFARSTFMFVSYFELAFFSLILANKIHRTKDLEKERLKFKNLADKDALSNLYNRRYFTRITKKIFKSAQKKQQNLSILMIDIDKFKNINDTYGHEIGDKVIVEISQSLLSLVRQDDIVIRFGGEEFVIVFENMPHTKSMLFANNICKTIRALNIPISSNDTIAITVSIGISELLFASDKNTEDILRRADKALYQAKEAGRDRAIRYEQK